MRTITNMLCAHEDCELVCRATPHGCGYHDSEIGSPVRFVGREALTGLRKGSNPGLSLPCIWQPGKSPTDDPPRKMMHAAFSAARNLHHLPWQLSHLDTSSEPKLSFVLTAVRTTFWLARYASQNPNHSVTQPQLGTHLQTSQTCPELMFPSSLTLSYYNWTHDEEQMPQNVGRENSLASKKRTIITADLCLGTSKCSESLYDATYTCGGRRDQSPLYPLPVPRVRHDLSGGLSD